ncbi:MAG: hypothetical protein IJI49_00860 [Bacilli bacterium]|nr:hypothetical protein [Bacilli bacterium]
MGNEVNNKEKLSIPVMIFSIVGIVLIVLGFMLCKNNNFRLQVISSDGIVSGIQTSTDADGNIVNKVITINYRAGKSDYSATLNGTNLDLKMGDRYTLYYDFFEPSSVSDRRSGYYGYIAFILGLIMVLKNFPRFVRIVKDNYL